MKYRMYPILNVKISNLSFAFENFNPKCPIEDFEPKIIICLIEVLRVHYFKDADFKSDFCF